jgi:hypothetical protein
VIYDEGSGRRVVPEREQQLQAMRSKWPVQLLREFWVVVLQRIDMLQ